ncbi:YifB family Mg chelatase-like AAA ATPase [Maricurvus nonylphenolicus]|uniref:YifB family Mg chelatase-like AAA ATPase n=1 Tax=Maricurvus nonylphenolicus TaxID=1008307 RepID=UPI0036F1A471
MSLAVVHTRAKLGIEAPLVTVEVHLSNGLPSLSIVGLPETAVKESKDRVRSAILNSQFEFPARRITVNLAPADLPKEGGRFDLAIALGILAASDQIPTQQLEDYEVLGELALSGELRPVNGCLPAAIASSHAERKLILPRDNALEAALCKGAEILEARTLLTVCAHLQQRELLPVTPHAHLGNTQQRSENDLRDIKGQAHAKRALEIAASGGHHLLLYGPPGTGKTMLASRLTDILPPLTETEALEVAAVQSVSGRHTLTQYPSRPFRAPHHTASAVALVGGGSQPKPGEISLSHRGVLFLDELPEYSRQVLEVMRQPLESGEVQISRAAAQVRYPANFQLIAAMNPCPCGYANNSDGKHLCRCTPDQVLRYRSKISGPLLDRIDLQVAVQALKSGELYGEASGDNSKTVQTRVTACRQRQLERQQKSNADLVSRELDQYCRLQPKQQHLLQQAVERLGLSARSSHRIIKVARTLADMEVCEDIEDKHLMEALGYRTFERQATPACA